MVLVNSFTHELRPKVKKTYHSELNTNQTTFSIATHLNLRYFPAIVSGSSVIDGNGLSVVVKLCRWIFVESAVMHVESAVKTNLVKEFSHNIVAHWQVL